MNHNDHVNFNIITSTKTKLHLPNVYANSKSKDYRKLKAARKQIHPWEEKNMSIHLIKYVIAPEKADTYSFWFLNDTLPLIISQLKEIQSIKPYSKNMDTHLFQERNKFLSI